MTNESFVRRAAILAAVAFMVRLLGFFYRIPLTNLIGDMGNAYYVLAAQVFSIAIILQHVAVKTAVVKLTSERIAKEEYKNAYNLYTTAMGFSVIVGLLFSFGLFFFSDQIAAAFGLSEASAAISAVAPGVFFVSVASVIFGYFQGMKTVMPTAISQIIDQLFKAVFSVVLAFMLFDPIRIHIPAAAATFGTTIGTFSAFVVIVAIYIKKRKFIIKVDLKQTEKRFEQLKKLLLSIMPIYAGVMIFAIANLVDIRMSTARLLASGVFSTDEVRVLVGQFTGKFVLLTTMPVSVAAALAIAVLPEISSSQTTFDVKSIKNNANKALRLSLNFVFPCVVGLAVLAYPILLLLFPNYPDGGILLQIGSVSMIFMAVFLVTQSVLQGVGYTWLPAFSALVGLIVKIIINHYLIYNPWINISGVVISTIACFLVASILNMVFIKKYVGIFLDIKCAVKPFISSLVMGFVCLLIYNGLTVFLSSQLVTFISIFSGFAVYFILQIFLKGIEESEIKIMPLPGKVKRFILMFLRK